MGSMRLVWICDSITASAADGSGPIRVVMNFVPDTATVDSRTVAERFGAELVDE